METEKKKVNAPQMQEKSSEEENAVALAL